MHAERDLESFPFKIPVESAGYTAMTFVGVQVQPGDQRSLCVTFGRSSLAR